MFIRLFLVFFIGVAGLLVLQLFGVKTGIAVVDSRLTRLNSVSSPEVYPMGVESGNLADMLGAARGIVDDFIDEFQIEPTKPARPAQASTVDRSLDRAEGLVVQVGVFRDPANSARLAKRITELGLITITQRADDGLHAVRIGPFPDRSLANEAARTVQEATGLDPLVMELGPASGSAQVQTRQ